MTHAAMILVAPLDMGRGFWLSIGVVVVLLLVVLVVVLVVAWRDRRASVTEAVIAARLRHPDR
jgi:uncharacterized membrane protein